MTSTNPSPTTPVLPLSSSSHATIFNFILKCTDGEIICNGRQMGFFNVVKSMELDLKIQITSLGVPFTTQIVSLFVHMLERTDLVTELKVIDVKWRDFVNCVNWFDPVDHEFFKYCLDAVIYNCSDDDPKVIYDKFRSVFERIIDERLGVTIDEKLGVQRPEKDSSGFESDDSCCSYCHERSERERDEMRQDFYKYFGEILVKCGIE